MSVAGVVKGEEEFEADFVGDGECVVKEVFCVEAPARVEGEGVQVGFFGGGDVLSPVFFRVVIAVAKLW